VEERGFGSAMSGWGQLGHAELFFSIHCAVIRSNVARLRRSTKPACLPSALPKRKLREWRPLGRNVIPITGRHP
jgi:hypothetical protein